MTPEVARYLAMTHHRLGHREEAKKWFDTMEQQMATLTEERRTGKVYFIWNVLVTMNLLRPETADLLGTTDTPSPEDTNRSRSPAENASFFFERGEAFAKANQPERAMNEYRKAVRLDPQPHYTDTYLRRLNPANKRALDQILADFREPLRVRGKIDPAWLYWISCWLPFASRGAEKLPGMIWISDMPWVRSTCGYGCPEATRDGHLGGAGLSSLVSRTSKGS